MKTYLKKYQNLKSILQSYHRVLVAFSGGVDSALVLKVACETLGAENVLAVTADSPSYPKEELDNAVKLGQEFGLNGRHLVIKTDEVENPNYAENPLNRCFFCKDELYTKLQSIAQENNIPHILDGANLSDQKDFRPGRKAAFKFGIKSPLIEAQLDKEEIRQIAKELKLSIWDKPAMACLSSRVPYGEKITPEKLAQIEQAESFLRTLGFRQLRVRHHEKIARIELDQQEIAKFLNEETRQKVAKKFKEIGFLYITLDLEGYRTGSLNEGLKTPKVSS